MAEHPALKGQRIDLLFLDTTYAKPNHTHPPQAGLPSHEQTVRHTKLRCGTSRMQVTCILHTLQDECIERMVKLMRQEAKERPNTLFVVCSCLRLKIRCCS